MLVAVVDRTNGDGTRKVKAAFEEVENKYESLGHRLRLPVSAEIGRMAVMGASKSIAERHTLFVSVRAVESGMLDGLIAHEIGHMLRTESGHPSHSPEVFRAISREVRIPRVSEGAFSGAFNHIQDIYADDLAFLVFATEGDGRAYDFFAAWVEGNAGMRGRNRWQNVGLAATNGFAIGNLIRHGLLAPEDGLWEQARQFDREAGFTAVDALASFYAKLPQDPTAAAFIHEVRILADLMARAAGA